MTQWYRWPLLRVFACTLLILILFAMTAPWLGSGPAAQTSGPKIWLQDSQQLPVHYSGPGMSSPAVRQAASAQPAPLAMASADVDGDGIADLLVGYDAGFIAVHRGNLDAFAPQSDASFQAIARGTFPPPFLPDVKTFAVPVRPDFIALGNFIGNGNQDLVVASRDGNALYVFAGDGKGNFAAPQAINLPGGVTTLAAGDLGNSAQFTKLIVGVSGPTGSSLLVYGTAQGLEPLADYSLPAPASNVNFGEFEAGRSDAAFLAGGQVFILRSSSMQLVQVSLPVPASALALGSFVLDRVPGLQMALLGSDGSIQIAAHTEFDPRPYTAEEAKAVRQAVRLRTAPNPLLPVKTFPVNGWKIVESFPSVATVSPGQAPVFFRTRVSSNGADDIMWLSASSGQMVLISHPDVPAGATTFLPGRVSVRAYSGAPVAALPMRINVDGRPGVMALHQGQMAPSMLMPIPDPTFFVNKFNNLATDDPLPTSPIANACNNFNFNDTSSSCSLREAILKANSVAGTDTIMVPAGTITLTRGRLPNDFSGNQGTLEVTDSVNIVGAGQNTTIIQGGANLSSSVDKVFSFNEDLTAASIATVSISNLTIQNGQNRGDAFVGDGFGGAFDFDTGCDASCSAGTGTANLFVTNVTIQNNEILSGQGGGFTTFNTTNGSGFATITNTIVQNNSGTPDGSGCCGDGGGIAMDARSKMVIRNSQIINNQAKANGSTNATGGGIWFSGQHTQPQSQIHASIISGNTAAGIGGGMSTAATLLIDQGTVISNNIAGGDTNGFGGGGIANNANDGLTLNKVTITGNSTTGNGGGIFTGNAGGGVPVTMNLSRLTGNSSALTPASSNLYNLQGTITVTDNWWGTTNPSSTIVTNAGSTSFTPFIVLTHTASPNQLKVGDAPTLTADFLHRNTDPVNSPSISASSLDVFAGLSVAFNNAVHGTINPATTAIGNVATISFATESNCQFLPPPNNPPCTATITTTTPHGFSVGQNVRISGVGVIGYNGFYTIAATTPTTFTYSNPVGGLAPSGGGTASVPTGQATATYTATSGGVDTLHAIVDGVTASATVTVIAPPSITKAFNPTSIAVNTSSTLTFNLANPNTGTALSGVAFNDNLPAGLVVAAIPNVTGSCGSGTITATAGSSSISLSGGTLTASPAPGSSCSFSVNVTGTTAGAKNNVTANVSSTEGGTGGTASATLNVDGPPTVSKAFGAPSIPLNGTTSLTFTLTNPGANPDTLTGIAFSDSLQGGLVVGTPNGLAGSCLTAGGSVANAGSVTAAAGSSSISLSGLALTSGGTCTFTVNVNGTLVGINIPNTTSAVTSTNGGTGAPSNTATLTVANPATHFAVSAPPSATAGTAISFTVTALDQFNNTATGYTGTVHFTSSDGSASLPANSVLTNGVGTFPATLKTVGSQTITATDTVTNSITGTSNAIAVSPAPATHFAVSAPASATAGTAFNVTVTALDQFNNTATAYAGTVHFTSSDGLASLPADSTLTNGVGTFPATLKTVGSQTITATDTANSSVTGTSNAIAVSPAAATHFAVSAPASATAGTAFNFTVTALDQFNNTATGYTGTVHFTSSDGSASLPANTTLTNGVGTFSATLKTAGSQTISATDTVTVSITGTSNAIAVGAASATHFAASAPSSATAGTAFNFTVTALDQFNNTATGYAGTAHFTSSDGSASLPANSVLTNGVGVFSATSKTAGVQTVTATDTVTVSITGTSNAITVSPAPATHFAVSAPASATAGTAFSFTVTALDQFNNTATAYAGTVHFTSSDGLASLPADSTLTNGVGTFSATLKTAGSQTITATDTGNASITGTSTIAVSPTAATHFAVSAPASAAAGTAFSFTVTALDQFNNTATGYAGTVHFSSSDGAATLPANSVLTNGAGSFTATLKTAGVETITATDTVTVSITGTSNAIAVSPAAATHFTVSAPSSATAGAAFNFTVTALDQFNNTATGYAGTVHFSSSDGSASLPADSTLTNGAGTFSATLRTSGSQTITATDTANASIAGTSNAIAVSGTAATHFTVSAPSSATAGTAFNFTVTALDQFNNTATGYAGTVHFSSSDGAATLPANATLTNGVGIFSATFKTAGSQTITATDTVTVAITGTSSAIVVSAAAATHFAVSAPASATAGTAFNFTVTAFDQFNNTATGYAGTVHFSSSDGSASLPANTTLTNGVGTFSTTLRTPGNQTVAATDTVNTSITGTSNTIAVRSATLSIAKAHVGQFHFGQNGAQYTLTVSNLPGTGSTVGPVTVVDTLPVVSSAHNLVPVSLSGAGWTCDLPSLTCTRSDVLPPGASYPVITFTVNIPTDIQNRFTNTATVSGGGDPVSHTSADPVTLGPPIIISSTDSGSATVTPGSPATFNFTVDTTALNPPPVVAFTCDGLPRGAACLFTPLAEGQPQSQLTMTVTTLGHGNAGIVWPWGKRDAPLYAVLLFPLLGLVYARRSALRGKTRGLVPALSLAGLMLLLALAGCGGSPMVTPPGTYTITVTGNADTSPVPAAGSTTVTLNVQQ